MEQTSEKPGEEALPTTLPDADRTAVNEASQPQHTGQTVVVREHASLTVEPLEACVVPGGVSGNVATPGGAACSTPPPVVVARRRRVKLPLVLFVATCLSTFFVGTTGWDFLTSVTAPTETLRQNWWQGATYMLAVMSILLAHEMGHFLQAVRYGVPASLPFFIPLPITPLGTMGAVIALGGSQADRKELFDIGVTGPLAGLVIAVPLTWLGLATATPFPAASDATFGGVHFGDPLIFKLLIAWLRPDVPADARLIVFGNPLVMAGWVGMLVTGLNMLPVGQLDGGHVAYALMGRRAWWLARATVLAAVVFILAAGQFNWLVMLALVVYLGIRHPPTANDRTELGRGRTILGWLSLLIPLFCFPPFPLVES